MVDVQERYRQKLELSKQHDISTLDERCAAWGDASVIDYQIFPFHELTPTGFSLTKGVGTAGRCYLLDGSRKRLSQRKDLQVISPNGISSSRRAGIISFFGGG